MRLVLGRLALAILLVLGATPAAGSTDGASLVSAVRTSAAIATDGGMDPSTGAALQAALDGLRTELREPGMSLAIRLPDGTVWTAVTGRAAVPPAVVAMDPTIPLSVGSITKTFVGALVMQEVESGRLRLDDVASTWLSRHDLANVTIAQLLQHTSGLADYFKNPEYGTLVFGDPTRHWKPPEILRLAGPPTTPPGRRYSYSNTDAIVLGRILEKSTGKRLGVLLRQRLLQPLALDSTTFQDTEPGGIPAAQGYLRSDNHWISWSDGSGYRPNTSAATVAWAAGAMLSTPSDLVRWAHALFADGSVVSPEAVALMTHFNKHDYGLGAERFFTTDDQATQEPMWGHSGSLRGFEAQLWYVPSRDVTIALMANRGRVPLRPSVQRLLAVLFSAGNPPPA